MTDSPPRIDTTYLEILDSVDAVIYIADMSNYELLFLNRKARETSRAQVGATCWKTLQRGQEGPCPFCTNAKLLDHQGNPKPPHIWQVKNTMNGEWWECRDQAIRWPDGRLVRLEIATNITVREKEEQELRIKEERLELALNSAEMGTWDWNPQTGATIYSERWAKMLGYDLKHLTLHVDTWTNLIHPDDKKQTMANLKSHLTGRTPIYEAEFRARTQSGKWRWMLDLGKVITRDSQGRPLRVTGTQQDITDRKKTEEALRASEENLQITLDSICDAVISTDIRQKIVRMNPVAENLTGWNRDQAVGQKLNNVVQIIDSRTGTPAEDPVKTVIETGDIASLSNHTVLTRKDGRKSEVAGSSAPIRDGKGNITGVVLVFRDVSEEYYLRKQMQRVQQLEQIGTLAGGIAHDFNNILSGFYGNLTLAEQKLPPGHPAVRFLRQAEISADRARDLTAQFLTFAKGGDPIKGVADLGEIIKETARFDLSGSSIKLIFSQPPSLWPVEVDKTQIQQVISNLVINAVQSMPDGGQLHIALDNHIQKPDGHDIKVGRYVKAVIRDEGKGIREELLPRIFDPYFSTKQTGRGLGLATVHSVMTRHNGYILVASNENVGTTFTLFLPVIETAPPPPTERLEQQKIDQPSQHLNILVMDDEDVIRSLTSEMLSIMGHSPKVVANGDAALKQFRLAQQGQAPFDLVILDLTIPGGMGGQETMQELLALNPEIRAIVSSGYTDDPIMAYYSEYGFKAVITKPYTFAELQQSINQALAQP